MVRLQPSSGRFDLLKPAEHGAGFVGVRPVQDESGRVWVGSLHGLIYVDGDRLRAQAQLLERQAYQDALTAAEASTEENEEALEQTAEAARESLLEALYQTGIFPLQEVVPEELPEATPEVAE